MRLPNNKRRLEVDKAAAVSSREAAAATPPTPPPAAQGAHRSGYVQRWRKEKFVKVDGSDAEAVPRSLAASFYMPRQPLPGHKH